MATRSTSYLSVLTLIRAKDEDSGNYTLQVENGDRTQSVGLFLEVKGQSMDYAEGFHPRCVKSWLVLHPPASGLHHSAGCHRGPDGHPPRLGHRPVCGVHHQRAADPGGGVVRLQKHQTVSSAS